MITNELDCRSATTHLYRLADAMKNPKPAMKLIGENLVDSTKQRFQTSTAPDGSRWKPNTVATLLGYIGKYAGSYRKDGRVTSKGGNRIAGKKPLIGETSSLSGNITYRLVADGLEIGSPQKYAAMQQFGGQKSEFPNLWGDIPARPFLGVSTSDEDMMIETVENYLQRVVG